VAGVEDQDPEERVSGSNGNGRADQAEMAAVVAAFAEAEADLAVIDAELLDCERARDAAVRALAEHPTALRAWRLTEDRDAMTARIGELLERRRPLAERHARLAGIVLPVRRRESEIAEMEAAIAARELLASYLSVPLGELPAFLDRVRPLCARSGGRVAIPPSLERTARAWEEGSIKRLRCDFTIAAASISDSREYVRRLRAGLPT
jgi:hypothetical protein